MLLLLTCENDVQILRQSNTKFYHISINVSKVNSTNKSSKDAKGTVLCAASCENVAECQRRLISTMKMQDVELSKSFFFLKAELRCYRWLMFWKSEHKGKRFFMNKCVWRTLWHILLICSLFRYTCRAVSEEVLILAVEQIVAFWTGPLVTQHCGILSLCSPWAMEGSPCVFSVDLELYIEVL